MAQNPSGESRIQANSSINETRVVQRGKPQPTTNYHGAQPPSAATEESSQANKISNDSSAEEFARKNKKTKVLVLRRKSGHRENRNQCPIEFLKFFPALPGIEVKISL